MAFIPPILAFLGTAEVAGTIGTAAVIGAGIAGGVAMAQGMSESAKALGGVTPPAQAAVPTTADAQVTAAQALTDRRRAILASGGSTDVTGGLGYGIDPKNLQKAQLLG